MAKSENFTYGINEKIGSKEQFLMIPSMIIGVGILNLPSALAEQVKTTDAWISILMAGVVAAFFSWIMMKVTLTFEKDTFFEFTAKLLSKPVTYVLALLFCIHFITFTFYETRSIANLAKHFLFDQTPVEVIGLLFLLLVSYAVSGSRSALIRLNVMFFPIVLFILVSVMLFNIPFFEFDRLKPIFITDIPSILYGAQHSLFSFLGFEILLFYSVLINKKKKLTAFYPTIGIGLVTFIYVAVYLCCLAIFSVERTAQFLYPTVELAKSVEFPGGIIERLESIFFTVWVMTIFNTSVMAFDIATTCLRWIIPKISKATSIFILLPITYLFSMLPQTVVQLAQVGEAIGYSGLWFSIGLPSLLFIAIKLKGGKKDEK